MSRKMRGTMRLPIKLWLWNVHPIFSSHRFVTGLAMSCISAAHRSHTLSLLAATLSSTSRVWAKLSLWPRPLTTSMPRIASSSGKISFSNPHWASRVHPIDGRCDAIIFISSSITRSREMIFMRSALRVIAANVSGNISNSSWVAKRIARIILSGSSLKVTSGSSGVRIICRFRSSSPSKRSMSVPKDDELTCNAMALIVKSRRDRSSSRVPFSTMGLRESARYDSLRAPTNSSSTSRRFTWAVPKLRNTLSLVPRPSDLATASASSMPLPTVTKSMSLEWRFRNRSRTYPPTV